MPVLVKVAHPRHHGLLFRALRAALVLVLFFAVLGGIVFAYEYHQYAGLVDQRLAQGPLFASQAQIYAAPQRGPPRPAPHRRGDRRRPAEGRLRWPQQPDGLRPTRRRPGPHQARAAKLSRRRRRHHRHHRWRSQVHHRRERRPTRCLQARTATHHRAQRRQESHQAPHGHLRRDSAAHGPGRPRHRGPPLLRALRHQLRPHRQVRRPGHPCRSTNPAAAPP